MASTLAERRYMLVHELDEALSSLASWVLQSCVFSPITNNLITLAISTDERGFAYNATLIASILRRTGRAVWVRCWCRGFLPESFETGRLRVEFRPAVEDVTGCKAETGRRFSRR